jgi:RNA polymerase sigma-70 factor (ECF subfamily)
MRSHAGQYSALCDRTRLRPGIANACSLSRERTARSAIAEGCATLDPALRFKVRCAFHLLAAIAACHATAPIAAETDCPQIAALYEQLTAANALPVVALNYAVAVATAKGPEAGLASSTTSNYPNVGASWIERLDLACGVLYI